MVRLVRQEETTFLLQSHYLCAGIAVTPIRAGVGIFLFLLVPSAAATGGDVLVAPEEVIEIPAHLPGQLLEIPGMSQACPQCWAVL